LATFGIDMSSNRASTSSPAHPRCQPPEPGDGESIEAALARHQQALVDMAQCFDDELRVRPESSLLSFLFFKVVVPFLAISTAISAFYSRMLQTAKPRFSYAEHGLALLHLVVAVAVLGLWWQYRKQGEQSRFGRCKRALEGAFKVAVPPAKESLARNAVVNRWIFLSLMLGIVFFMPALFYLLRANALEQLGTRYVIDTIGICRPTVGGYNPFEGSDTCEGSGANYVQRPSLTDGNAVTGSDASSGLLGVGPATLDPAQIDTAEVRLDGTTALATYLVVLLGGIGVSMAIWWNRQRRARWAEGPVASPSAGSTS
jgi:hypothetical protein